MKPEAMQIAFRLYFLTVSAPSTGLKSLSLLVS